jgi:hypothetical protein
MPCHTLKIVIARQHPPAVTDAQLRQERTDRTKLNAMTTAAVAKRRRLDVIGSVGHEEGQCREPLQNPLTALGARARAPSSAAAATAIARLR